MIVLIFVFAAIIILILALTLSGSASKVESSDRLPIANIGEDVLLSCFLPSSSEESGQTSDVSVTWRKAGLSGLVYKYENGAPDLEDQNPEYSRRTQLFPDAIGRGNVSLLLKSVRISDGGVYNCTVSSSGGGGTVSIHLRAAAFSAPTFTVTKNTLIAEAERWLPKPKVTWLDNGGNILNRTTTFSENSVGIFSLVSTLQPVSMPNTYTCSIQNALVTSTSEATITDSGVSGRTLFTFNAALSILTSNHLRLIVSVLSIYYLT